ncbi:MAG: MFS transporter [Chloroflexi bacterium]|nr:MFS transporter [Chloroflexota bacterium]
MTALTTAPAPHSPFAIFRNRNFTWLWIGQLIGEMGSALTEMAAFIFVYQQTGSALNVGLMMVASSAPSLLVGLVAGVFVDRYDRKRIMIAANLLQAGLIVAIPFLLPLNIIWLYVLIMLAKTVGQFFNPAHAAALGEITSEDELNAANSMMAVSSYGAQVIGYALAGLITTQFPIAWAFYADAATFFLSALLILMVRVPAITFSEETNVASIFQNLHAGIKAIDRTPIVRSLFLVFTPVFILFSLANTIRLPFAIEALGASEFEYSLIESVSLVGLVGASLFMARVGDRWREGQWLALSFIGVGLAETVFALLSSVPAAYVIIVFSGFVYAPSVIANSLIIQRHIPRELRGRVFSAFFVLRDTLFVLGMALAGLADVWDVRLLYLAGGLGVLAIGFVTLIMPGLGQPAAEWRRAIQLLRTAPDAPGLGVGRALSLTHFARLSALLPTIAALPPEKQRKLQANMTVIDAPEGTAIIRRYETSDAAYFILEGQAIAGWEEEAGYKALEMLQAGDFFGEIAALTGLPRTAHVITERPTTLIQVTAGTLREMAADPQLNRILLTRMTERMIRMNMIDLGHQGHFDQQILRELRTPATETKGS